MYLSEEMNVRQEKTEFIRLAVPLIAQSLVTALVGAADAIMTGTLDQQALSAVALAGQVMQLYSIFIMSFCTGSTVLASQYYGVNDLISVRKVMNITLKTAFTGAVVFFLATLFSPRLIMRFLTNEETLIAIGIPYLRLISPSFLFMGFSQIYMNIMKNTGRAKQTSLLGCITATLNIILNYILIFGHFGLPQMGVTGAAVATTAARAVELILVLIFSQKGNVRFRISDILLQSRGISRKYWRYVLPTLIQSSAWKLANVCTVAIIGHLGADFVAASSYALIVYSIVAGIADGYGTACGICIGQYLGREDTQKAKQAGNRLLASGMLLSVFVGVITCLCCPLIIRANSVTTEVAKGYLRIMIFFTAFRCIGKYCNATLSIGFFSAGGDVMYLMKLDIINMWCVVLPLGILSAYVLHLPPVVIYCVLNLDEFYKLFFMLKRYRKQLWVKNLTKKEWAPHGKYENDIRCEIVRRMPLGVIVISAFGRISMANQAAADLLGKELSDFDGNNYIDFFMRDTENSAFADTVINAVKDKQNTHREVVSYKRENGIYPIRVESSFMEDEDCRIGVCLMISKIDCTSQENEQKNFSGGYCHV